MQDTLKVVTLYSPSHETMLKEYFLPSFPKDDRLKLKIVEAPQLAGDKPEFNSPEWKSFMHIKAKLLYDELLSTPENECYVFLDVDIINVQNFFDYALNIVKDVDFAAQNDSFLPQISNICTGIIIFKNTEQSRNLLKAVNIYLDKFSNEQDAVTYFATNHKKFAELLFLKYKLLPFNKAFTYGALGREVWTGTEEFDIPPKKDLIWVHANFCHYDKKVPLLAKFKEKLK